MRKYTKILTLVVPKFGGRISRIMGDVCLLYFIISSLINV